MIVVAICNRRGRVVANPPIYVTNSTHNVPNQMPYTHGAPPPPYNPNYQLQYPVTVQYVQAPPSHINFNNQGGQFDQTFQLPPTAPTIAR